MPNPKKYLDYVGLTEYTSLLKDYISDQQHTIDGYYDVTTTHKFYKNYDAGTFSNEITGAFGNIYVDLLTNKLYKYDNNAYAEITTSVSTNFENSGVNAGTVTINGTSSTIKVPTGDTSSTVAVGNHTHNTTIATDSGTSTVDMSANTTYKLTAGDTNVIFKTPVDTTYVFDGTYDANTNKAATVSTVTNAISELPEPMVFKGSLGADGTITTLPTASSSNKGYVYKVITAGTYASQPAKVGDTFISDGSAWVLIPSGDEPDGTVTNVAVANGGGLTVSGSPVTSSGTITVGHSNSVTAKTSSSVKKFTYDAHGHVTGSSELSTAESNALASGITSTDVAQITTNKNNILSIYNTGFAQKNVMHIVLDEVKALQSWATFINNTITFGNLAVTFNDDNSITLNGSHTADVAINFKDLSHINIPTNAVGAASANITLSNDIFFGLWGDSGVPNLVLNNGVDIPSDYASKYSRGFIIRVSANTVCNNVRIYPMVCDKALYQASSAVVPYAMSNAELTDKVETNKNNILTLETMNGAKNKFDYEAWKNCGVFQGTKTINGNSFTIVASDDDCFTWYENGTPRPYPINARIPCNAGDKVVFTWEYTPLSGQTNDRVGIFANGLANSGLFALASANAKKLEFTAPTGTTYFSIRFGVQVAGNSAIYGNIQIQSKASYDAGFTDYQPYAMSNAELTAAIQAIQAQLANQ